MNRTIAHVIRFARRASGAIPLSLAAILCAAPAAEADLIGAQVTLGVYCCTSPTAPDLVSNVVTGTVPVTFPVGSLTSALGLIEAADTVSADQIIISSAASGTAASGSFNGAVFAFSGLSSPITNVTVDPTSTLVPTSIAFTGASVDVNEAGEFISAGSQVILDVTTGVVPPPVSTPEPSTLALIGAGLAGLAVFRRRQALR
jgi:hypothetical protein